MNPGEFALVFVTLGFYVHFFVRPLTILLHELGHGIPALLFTEGPVQIYIGSYGDEPGQRTLNLGRLIITFSISSRLYDRGLCVRTGFASSWGKQFLIVLLGPLTSLVLGLVLAIGILALTESGLLIFYAYLLVASFLADAYFNLRADGSPVELNDGRLVPTDGDALRSLWALRGEYQWHLRTQHLYRRGELEELTRMYLERFEESGDIHYVESAFAVLLDGRDYERVRTLYEDLPDLDYRHQILSNIAYGYSRLDEHVKSVPIYDRALQIHQSDAYVWNNRGYAKLMLERYAEGIEDFNTAINVDPDFAYPYANRGYCRLSLGELEEGYDDVQYSLGLDPENGYAYRSLGYYHLLRKEKQKALDYFREAATHDDDIPKLAELWARADALED